jgi:hypothetical protein
MVWAVVGSGGLAQAQTPTDDLQSGEPTGLPPAPQYIPGTMITPENEPAPAKPTGSVKQKRKTSQPEVALAKSSEEERAATAGAVYGPAAADRRTAPATAPVQTPEDLKPLEPFLPEPGSWVLLPNSTIQPAAERAQASLGSDTCDHMKCKSWTDIFNAWNGIAFDGRRVWALANGGHAGYGGNEVYKFDLGRPEAGWSLEVPPQPLTGEFSRDENDDGIMDACPTPSSGPMSSHTYNGVIWSPRSQDILWLGSVGFCLHGMGPSTAWVFDIKNEKWTERPDLNKLAKFARTEIDPTNGDIIVIGREYVYLLDPNTKQIMRRSERGRRFAGGGLAFDAHSRTLYAIAPNAVYATNIPETGKFAGLSKLADVPGVIPAMGFAMHSPTGDYILWDGAGQTYRWRPGAAQLERLPVPSVVPTNTVPNRVFSQWKYIPGLDIFFGIVPREGIWLYRLPDAMAANGGDPSATVALDESAEPEVPLNTHNKLPEPAPKSDNPVTLTTDRGAKSVRKLAAPADSGPSVDTPFEDLCARPETLLCDPMDDTTPISGPGITASTPNKLLSEAITGPWYSWRAVNPHPLNGRPLAEVDPTMGNGGSMKCIIPSQSAASYTCEYDVNTGDDYATMPGAMLGDTIRVRFNIRLSCAVLYTDCNPQSPTYKQQRRAYAVTSGGGGFKIFAVSEGYRPGNIITGGEGLGVPVWGNCYQRGYPCGYISRWNTAIEQRFTINGVKYFDAQPGGPGDPCYSYDQFAACFMLEADEWMTFEETLYFGGCSAHPDGTSGAHVWMRAAREGQPLQDIVDYPVDLRCAEIPVDQVKLARVGFNPYDTGKDPAEVHPEGYIWYDDLWIAKIK